MSSKKLQNFRIDKKLHKQFHLYCVKNNTTMTDVLIGHIEDLIHGEIKLNANQARKKDKPEYDPLAAIRQNYDGEL